MRDAEDSSEDDGYEPTPLVKLNSDMRMLSIDVTFDGLGHVTAYDNPQSSQPSGMSLALASVHKIKEL